MRTTLDLPDELMRAVKIRAVRDGRKLKDMIADLIRRGLAWESTDRKPVPGRVQLPLVHCAHDAHPDDEVTPVRVTELLLREEASRAQSRS